MANKNLTQARRQGRMMARDGCSPVEMSDFCEDAYGGDPTLHAAFWAAAAAEASLLVRRADRAQRTVMRRAV